MRKKLKKTATIPTILLLSTILLLTATTCLADVNEWAWMSGSDTTNALGVYGTKGIADSANVPGARNSSISWTDQNGDLWLFGGYGWDSLGNDSDLNDLWRYEMSTGEWTWMSGSDTTKAPGVYGTKGLADPANVPGARGGNRMSWTDENGDLWLFGGHGWDSLGDDDYLNDLWRYEMSTGEWTWMSGDNETSAPGVYGIKNIADPANVPGARNAGMTWTDKTGDLWLFGGVGYDSAGKSGLLNDLWRYDTSTGEWAWINGSNTTYQTGVYGTKGIADPANVPGVRYGGIAWTDKKGSLWLFGGYGYDSAGYEGYLNALWRYDIATGEWAWMSGSDTYYQTGVYGTKGIADHANVPGARNYSLSWTDQNGDLWLFGGVGLGSIFGSGRLNDLWRYDMHAGEWTWVSGDNETAQPGVYGTRLIANLGNVPGSRHASISWTDQNGNLWLFGGDAHDSAGTRGRLNDLWRYELPECFVNSNCDNGEFCDGDELCDAGACIAGSYPCPGDFCNETHHSCLECLEDDDCFAGFCVDNICVECALDADCDNGVYCDGMEMCDAGVCASGTDPCPGEVCDEPNLRCVECLEASDCGDFYTCESNICFAFPTFSSVTEVKLKGPGELDVIFDPNGMDIARIELTGTTRKSSLGIESRLKSSIVFLDQLDVNGALKEIKGINTFLIGAMTATEGIEKIQIAGTETGSSIEAPWISSLSITTDFAGDMTLTGAGSPPKGLTLGKATIKGMLWRSQWLVSGDVGSVSVTFWGPGSTLAVGVEAGADNKFFTNDDVVTGGWLGKIQYKDYENYNAGDAFGIIADEFSKMKTSLPFRDDDFYIQQR